MSEMSVGLTVLCILQATIYAASVEHVSSNFNSDVLLVELLKRVDKLEERIGHYGEKELQYQLELRLVKEELNSQKDQVNRAETEIQQQRREIQELKELLQFNKQPSTDTKSDIILTPSEMKSNEDGRRNTQGKMDIKQGTLPLRHRRVETEVSVAFFAKLGTTVEHLGQNQNIKFEQVVTNVGNAYNPHLGAFIAPVAGIYVFDVTITTNSRVSTHCGFAVNANAETTFYLNGAENAWDSTSQTIILQLQKGDDVSVQQRDLDKAIAGVSHSVFSGFLLTPLNENVNIVGK